MSKRTGSANRVSREIAEMADALNRLGALDAHEHEKITMRHLGLEKIKRAKPPSAREIVEIRTEARMSQSVFARLLDVSTGTLSKWERGELVPRGPAGRLLEIFKTKGVSAVL